MARNFAAFHRLLPEDVIFTCLSDQFGWDPIHEVFGQLEGRERWPIPWLEDDPAIWFPQLHAERFASDMARAEQFGCQGMLGIHWRHRIVDPVATYMARRAWNGGLTAEAHYRAYAATQAAGPRAAAFAQLLHRADTERSLLSTWTGEYRADGHAQYRDYAGDYSEGFTVESGNPIADELLASQAAVVAELNALRDAAETPLERERLGYWAGQVGFLDPYARAWRCGTALERLVSEQYPRLRAGEGEASAARAVMREQGVPLWLELLGHMRAAVLAFQRTVATRNDQGMLASVHNKFVRRASTRFRESLLEFFDPLPAEADAALAAALAPDAALDGSVFVPTRPSRLEAGATVQISAAAPGARELTQMTLRWRPVGATAWQALPMQHIGRRTYTAALTMPSDASEGIEYAIDATFASAPPLVVTAPPSGAGEGFVLSQ